MKIPFTCPHCGHFTEVEPRYAGQSGPCGRCGKSIKLPVASDPPAQNSNSAAPRSRASRQRNPRVWLLSLLGIVAAGAAGGLLWLLITTSSAGNRLSATKTSHQAKACQRNLEQIGRAFLAYHEQHGHFPASINEAEGNLPGTSWRVAILPFLGQEKLHDTIDKRQWDGPANQRYTNSRPPVYAAIDDETLASEETSYLAVLGDDMAFNGEQTRRKDEFTDGLAETILVVEVRGLGVLWLEPQDLATHQSDWIINEHQAGIGSCHSEGGIHVLMANGDVHWLDNSTPPEVLLAMCTINGGEAVDIDRWKKK